MPKDGNSLMTIAHLDFWNPEAIPAQTSKDSYIYFGRISREKGLRYVLEAQKLWEDGYEAGEISEPPLKFLIAGSGPCEGNLRAKVAQLKLKTVELPGPLGIEDLRKNLGRARFSVLPSIWYENGPMAALESLAVGLPLVGSSIGGVPGVIHNFIRRPFEGYRLIENGYKTPKGRTRRAYKVKRENAAKDAPEDEATEDERRKGG